MRCPACGSRVNDDAMFCQQCGARVSVERDPQDIAFDVRGRSKGRLRRTPPRSLRRARASSFAESRDYLDEESLVWEGSYSWKGMIHEFSLALLTTIGLTLAGLFLLQGEGIWTYLGVFLGAIWLLLFCVLLFRKFNFSYKLTDQRLIHESGILYRVLDRTEMIDIDDVRVEQDIIERIANVGKIRLRTSDRTHPRITFRGIDRPRQIADLIDDARRRERMRRGIHVEAI